MKIQTVRELVELYGAPKDLAALLGITPKQVRLWVRKNELPLERMHQIEEISGGFIKTRDLIHLKTKGRR